MLGPRLLRGAHHMIREVSTDWERSPHNTHSHHSEKYYALLTFFDRLLYKWGGTTFTLEAGAPLPCKKYVLYLTGFHHWLEIKCEVDVTFCWSLIVHELFDALVALLRAEDYIKLDGLKSEMSSNLTADYCVHLLRELAFNEIYCEKQNDLDMRNGIADAFWIRSGAEMTVKLTNLYCSLEPCPIRTELSFPQSVLPPTHIIEQETIDYVVKMLKDAESPEKQPLQHIDPDCELEDAVSIRLFQEEGYSLPLHLSACPKRPIQAFRFPDCPAYWNATIKYFFDDLCIFLGSDMQIEVLLSLLRNNLGSMTGDLGYVVRLTMSRWEWLVVYTDQPRIDSYRDRHHLRDQLHAFEMLMMANVYENILKRLDVPGFVRPSLEEVDRSAINRLAKFVAKLSQHLKQSKWFRDAVDRGNLVWDCQEMPETLKFFWRCVYEEGDVSMDRLQKRQRELQEKAMRKMKLLANQLGVDCDVMMSMRQQPREDVVFREKIVKEKNTTPREKVVKPKLSPESSSGSEEPKRKRGRPPKRRLFEDSESDFTSEGTNDIGSSTGSNDSYKKRRRA